MRCISHDRQAASQTGISGGDAAPAARHRAVRRARTQCAGRVRLRGLLADGRAVIPAERKLTMAALSMQTLSIVWAGAFLGALAAGGAGCAFALVASSIWLHGLEPLQTTALVVACGSLLHVTLVWPIRESIEPSRLYPFIIGAVVAVPAGG